MSSLPTLLALCAAGALVPSSFADLTSAQVPSWRGDEGTAVAGWADWSLVAPNGVASPDNPISTPSIQATITTSDGPSFGTITNGVACLASPSRFFVGYGGLQRPVSEVVVQIAGTGLDGANVALAYVAMFSPDPDYVGPVEVIDLAPNERLYRFRTSARGLGLGTTEPISAFAVDVSAAGPVCIDEVLLDVRHTLEPEFSVTCAATQNSTGLGAGIDASGSSVAADNDFTLTATGVPAGTFGIFIVSATAGFPPCPTGCGNTQGTLCLDGTIARVLPALQAGSGLSFSQSLDLSALPFTPAISVTAGSTWYFQGWFRDSNPMPTSNFTSAIGVAFR